MSGYQSWGRYPKPSTQEGHPLYWRPTKLPVIPSSKKMLPFGLGRSQGDSCLNDQGILLDTSHLDRFINFDISTGRLKCEAGVTLAAILELVTPHGWMLPVIPGTKYVTIGGAIANDVHGKNHSRAGTFGRHVTAFALLRSNGEYECSLSNHGELFAVTIGGLGLTGLITWAEIQLTRVPSQYIEVEQQKFSTVTEALALLEKYSKNHEYVVGQFDGVRIQVPDLRGVVMAGNHSLHSNDEKKKTRQLVSVPLDAPSWLLNNTTMGMFNWLYNQRGLARGRQYTVHYDPYFFPLDSVGAWNRLYGKRGFVQYQCVVPQAAAKEALTKMLEHMEQSAARSYLSSLKIFGGVSSPGMLSFPRQGVVVALDFPFTGRPLLELLSTFDEIVQTSGGAVYPAKDARMSKASFQAYYPHWQEFSQYIDPAFSSSFWRRVTDEVVGSRQ